MMKHKQTLLTLSTLLLLLCLPSATPLAETAGTSLICSNCQVPIGDNPYYQVDDQLYDSACYVAKFIGNCGYCKKSIMGKYYTERGIKYHEACMIEHVAFRCLVCDRPLLGLRFTDDMGGYLCEEHLDSIDQCFSCQRFVKAGKTAGLHQFDDLRYACGSCFSTAVGDLKQAEKLMREVIREMTGLGIKIKAQVSLKLVNQEQLRLRSRGFASDPLGVCLYLKEKAYGEVTLKDFQILILDSLPVAHMRSVMAHELMHVWMFFNAGEDHDPLLCEGSCEYASYRILLNDSSEPSQQYLVHLLNNKSSVYGKGFQQVLNLVNRIGIPEWLEYLKNNNSLPSR